VQRQKKKLRGSQKLHRWSLTTILSTVQQERFAKQLHTRTSDFFNQYITTVEMGEKRHYGDYAEHPDRAAKRHKEAGGGNYSDKPRYQQPGFKKHARRPESSNWAKKRARTIERRLRNPDNLPANVQRDLESELAALQRQIEERQDKRLRAHMIGKYHMLRFFGKPRSWRIENACCANLLERKKATRRQKQLKKRHDTTDDAAEKAELAEDLRVAEIDVLYPQYYPFLEPYVSLYPQSGNNGEGEGEGEEEKDDKEDDKDTAEKQSTAAQFTRGPRPPMWEEIKTTYEAGGLRALQKIRDRQPPKGDKQGKQGKEAKGAKGGKASAGTDGDKSGKKSKETKNAEEGSESDDGGFFE
jgi:hypothetical protein